MAQEDLADAASRARGATVLAAFGSLWVAGAASLLLNRPDGSSSGPIGLTAVICCLALLSIVIALATSRRLSPYAQPWPEGQKREFWLINLAQYVALSAAVYLLGHGHLQRWLVPAGIAIVGAHFLPLARTFRSHDHALIGLAMIIVAAGVALLVTLPLDPKGIFAGGLTLILGSILLSVRANRTLLTARV